MIRFAYKNKHTFSQAVLTITDAMANFASHRYEQAMIRFADQPVDLPQRQPPPVPGNG